MVDRVYKSAIPEFRKTLEGLRREFSKLELSTDWVHLRVDPLLKHSAELERRLSSRRFSMQIARLSRGVAQFHSDLVYLRTNVKELQKLLLVEQKRRAADGRRAQ
jgi:hypothetical protein